MKQMYFLLVAFLVFQHDASARDDAENMTTNVVNSGGGGFPHFNPQSNSGSNVVPQSYRLIARTDTKYSGSMFVPVDSLTYNYGGGRGGIVNQDDPTNDESILFDNSYTYLYNSAAGVYDNKLYRAETFDSENRIMSLTYSQWHISTSSWRDSARYLYTYMPGTNKMDASLLELSQGVNIWVQHDQSSLIYNGNNVTSVNSNSYDATFTYDANNNILTIQDKVFDHSTGVLNNSEYKTYTYDGMNEPVTYTLKTWDAGTSSWINQKYWEYTYSAGQLITAYEYNWDGGNWLLYAKHTYTYVNSTDKKGEMVMLWNASTKTYTNYTNQVWTYNAQGLVSSITDYTWNNGAGSWDHALNDNEIRYYYEYYAPTSVNKIAGSSNIGIYPVPASTTINLSLKWQTPANFTIGIYSITGQCVMSWNEAATASYSKSIDISGLASGNYYVKAISPNEIATTKLVIQK